MDDDAGRSGNKERAERILDAAARLIVHYGYDKTTVEEIAQEAGVSKGAVYLHWRSKEALFEALLWREIGRYIDDWLARVEADPDGGTFYGMYKNSLVAMKDNPFMVALFGRDRRVLGNYVQRFAERQPANPFAQRVTSRKELLKLMQDVGIVRADVDPEVVAYILTMTSLGMIKMDEVIPPEQAPPFEIVMDTLTDMLRRALAPPEGGDSEAGKRIVRQMVAASRAAVAQAQKKVGGSTT